MAKGRRNGEGSVTKLSDGRYQARITLVGGKRKAYYGKTWDEAWQKMNAAQNDRRNGFDIVAENVMLGQYLRSWLEIVRPTVRPRTLRRYSELMTLHVISSLGKEPLATLSPVQVQALYSRLSDRLSPTTIHHLHAVLHEALEKALRLRLVVRNVTTQVDPPRNAEREMHVLSRQQVQTLFETVQGDRLEALYVVAIATGMRQGELLALRWRDVDLAADMLSVKATLQHTKEEGYVLRPPKTKQSRRRITLGDVAVRALQAHRAQQARERLAMGSLWDSSLDLVFPNTLGKPMDGTNLLHYHFYPLLKRAGLPRVRFHDLRHTAATLLLARGVNPKLVSERLGHASISITLDTYSHILPDMQAHAAAEMDAALSFG